jgi:hypothetical protein
VTISTGTSSAVVLENAELSDAEVIQQVLDGNTALFELLMRRYNERVYRAARAIVRDDLEAEDVIQRPTSMPSRIFASSTVRPNSRRG